MKKFFTGLYAFLFVALCVIGATSKNHEVSKKVIPGSVAMASVGAMGMRKGGDSQRAIYQSLKDDPKYSSFNIAPSFIRAEAYLANGQQSYTFQLNKFSTDLAVEEKLNQQDAFLVNKVGIFLLKEVTAVPGVGELLTYPSPAHFPDESGALQNSHLEVVYNGKFIFRIGETTYLPDLSAKDCRVVRTAQQLAAGTGFGGTARSERLPGDGLIPLVPTYTLKGRENNEIVFQIPSNSAQKLVSATGTYTSKIVLWLEGFKIIGAGGQSQV